MSEKEDARLESRRAWLRSLSQSDRDFIAKYGEDAWRRKKDLEQAFTTEPKTQIATVEETTQPEETIHLGLRESMEVSLFESHQNFLKNMDRMNKELKELQSELIRNLDKRNEELTQEHLDFVENLNKRNYEVTEKMLETYGNLNKNMTAQSEVFQKYWNRAIELQETEHSLELEKHKAFMEYIALKMKHEKEKG
jgi:16S rRNA C1402 (ribose-2'-O) methylase RsmI